MVRPMGEVLREIDELNAACAALRRAYLEAHPDAPRTKQEREHSRLMEQARRYRADHPNPE